MKRRAAAAAFTALTVLFGLGVAAVPAQASISGCLRDNGLTMEFRPETGHWLSYNTQRASGCGEATVDWISPGWSNTPDNCFYGRIRVYVDGEWIARTTHGPFCSLGLHQVRSNVVDNRPLKLEVWHASEYMQRRTIVPYLRWYF